ncbi:MULTISPECIES: hypothetical protein [Bacteroidales]|jgi:hypothetical protein|uniref:hypothetical protein n=1 Tax=Bacteroidales TaxID=171549 RepID=UPI002591B34B|nr:MULTISPECIES: hypothetical protein [Bacteroidales]
MNLIQRIFGTKDKTEALVVKAESMPQAYNQGDRGAYDVVDAWRYQQILSMLDRLIHPSVVGNNFIKSSKIGRLKNIKSSARQKERLRRKP